jgi:hypothetical protein
MSDSTLFSSHGSKSLIEHSGRVLTRSASEQTTGTIAVNIVKLPELLRD